MELRYNEVERARGIYERYVRCLPEVKSWVRYAKFEMKSGDVARARTVYERSVQELEGEANMVGIAKTTICVAGLQPEDVRAGCEVQAVPAAGSQVNATGSCCNAPAGGAVHEVCGL